MTRYVLLAAFAWLAVFAWWLRRERAFPEYAPDGYPDILPW